MDASNGASDYGNKFGEPVVGGYMRTFGMRLPSGERWEWIKPIMFRCPLPAPHCSTAGCLGCSLWDSSAVCETYSATQDYGSVNITFTKIYLEIQKSAENLAVGGCPALARRPTLSRNFWALRSSVHAVLGWGRSTTSTWPRSRRRSACWW